MAFVTVRAEGEGTRVRVRAPLFRHGVSLTLSGVSTGVAGAGGWCGGFMAGWILLASGLFPISVMSVLPPATAAVFLPAALGAVAGGALGLKGFRGLYHGLVRRAESALRGMLGAVAIEAEGGAPGVLRAPDEVAAEPRSTEGRALGRRAEEGSG